MKETQSKEKKCPECGLIKPIDVFVTVFGYENPRGKYCKNCFADHQRQHAMLLMEGRDFCLYCGKKIEKAYDWTPKGNSAKTYLHEDHMDPLSRGGKNSKDNTVYCCVECNLKKSNKLFADWLLELEPEYQKLSRSIYVEKHLREPEAFDPESNNTVLTIIIEPDIAEILATIISKKR